ncbi:MAG: hypothetical protein AAFW70_28045 [Cyanobacteria bacterium J06635_10]
MQRIKKNRSQSLHKVQLSNLDFYIENNWSPYIEKELLVEVKSPNEVKRNPQKSELKSFCLLLGVLGLLSISMCVQADSIAQGFREMVRISDLCIAWEKARPNCQI